ncbi:hypothetical protein [Xanthomonas prunicola]|uniref:EF-hand domain-containing protein n=1 Tax=Xanthomonas prunicola TaxID=2053930 RepID=A0A9Q9J171_9XANT|nr:hypothetical protein [Xanthomonas prunicola]UXA48572.1 hypothetical protein M0D44_20245 [Xanthomonas prunicola]UXA56976.1 hypothetical protein M0D47_19890 [Xanthomonas prunicola]UXA62937.1 hypothetical protein M0D48_08315 [Xanthomonas prunicola]UXA65137.1 hypothetical protein M0D43_19965 [Xanthomonas prunicola]
MNHRFLLALLAASAASSPAWSSDIGEPATWQSPRSAELNRTGDLPKLTEALIAKFDPDGNIVPPTVSEAQFIDLDGDGTLELVALVDYSGRQFFNMMIIITTVNAKPVVVTYRSNGANMERLGERIITEPENPNKLIVADRFIEGYKGSTASAKEQRLLELRSATLQDVSMHYPSYYLTKRLPALEKQARMSAPVHNADAAGLGSMTADENKRVLRQQIERAREQSLGT